VVQVGQGEEEERHVQGEEQEEEGDGRLEGENGQKGGEDEPSLTQC
jgi:hypothetical protein